MKQKTCIIHDSYDAVKFLDQIKNSSDYQNAKAVLVNIYTEHIQKDYIEYLSNVVRKRLNKAQLTGLTCLLGFAQGERQIETTILTVLFFYKSEIEVLEYDFSKIDIENAKKDFIRAIENTSDLKGIQVFTTPLKNTETNDFLSSVNSLSINIPIFGAGAGYNEKIKNPNLYIFGSNIYENALIITLFKGKNLKIYAESTLGWTPIGKEMKVTEVIDNHIIKTIDNKLAGDIYKNYLGVTATENFVDNTCEFPFMLRRGNSWIARMPLKKDENGYIQFAADIHKGEKLVFSYGSKKFILKQSFKLAEYMSNKDLEGLLLHVCRNRYAYLKDDELYELQAFSNFYRETAGCFAFAEILYKNNSGGLQNSALVAVGFKEIDDSDESSIVEDCFIEDSIYYKDYKLIDFSKIDNNFDINQKKNTLIPFEERIINFLHATSLDLYLANKKLEDAATIDGLTGIFNRKKISERIEYELKKRDKIEKIKLIMFDIDNFKHVNDNYGHDMGDEVLKKIAATAKEKIRQQDSIGRWGGEEFMILLTEATMEDAIEIAERIRKEIFMLKWEKMNQISISLGLSQVYEKDDIQSLYKRVDNRLYYAKTHGKNQVVFKDE
ncbi:MAG: GGDEF domain-containing protein [Treponema sp.]|nr:GGDEF domain-containing protein [Treponema sp.]